MSILPLATAISLVVSAASGAQSSSAGVVQGLALPTELGLPFEVAIRLKGELHTVFLEPRMVRAAGFQLLVQERGGVLRATEPPAPRTYRGTIIGQPGSVVTASLLPSGLRAVITGPTFDFPWEIEPLGLSGEHGLLHDVREVPAPPDLQCGFDDASASRRPQALASAEGGGFGICEISIDCDVDYYASYGSDVGETLAAAEDRINGITPLYEDDADITFELGTVIVRTDAQNDPYADYGGDYPTLLNLFADEWDANQTAILRDTAHLFTSKSGNASGLAELTPLCSCHSYAVSRAGAYNPLYANILVAHELGHLFGASHCDAWQNCWVMCSTIGGCGGAVLEFSNATVAQIQAVPDLCLSDPIPAAPPVLSTISPLEIPALGVVPAVITGTGLADTKKMRVVAPWGQIIEECSFTILDDATLEYQTPKPLALGEVQVSAVGTPGTSNALVFEYVVTDPPLTVAPANVFLPTTVTWKMGAQPNLNAVLTLSLNDGTTMASGGFTLLANGVPVALGALDAAGLASHSRSLPAILAPGTIYSQLTVFDGGVLIGASNIHTMQLKEPIGL